MALTEFFKGNAEPDNPTTFFGLNKLIKRSTFYLSVKQVTLERNKIKEKKDEKR